MLKCDKCGRWYNDLRQFCPYCSDRSISENCPECGGTLKHDESERPILVCATCHKEYSLPETPDEMKAREIFDKENKSHKKDNNRKNIDIWGTINNGNIFVVAMFILLAATAFEESVIGAIIGSYKVFFLSVIQMMMALAELIMGLINRKKCKIPICICCGIGVGLIIYSQAVINNYHEMLTGFSLWKRKRWWDKLQ